MRRTLHPYSVETRIQDMKLALIIAGYQPDVAETMASDHVRHCYDREMATLLASHGILPPSSKGEKRYGNAA